MGKILDSENIKKSKEKKTNDIYEIFAKNSRENKKYKIEIGNIINITLINSIFEKELTETGLSEECTKFEIPQPFTNDKKPSLVLFDSRGIEVDEENADNSL